MNAFLREGGASLLLRKGKRGGRSLDDPAGPSRHLRRRRCLAFGKKKEKKSEISMGSVKQREGSRYVFICLSPGRGFFVS